ncbi:MAG: hypothetical protein E6Q90_12350 [Actinobacteria bacterium]|nr:MAG: hypothetical protein E6Q90_12350 [Actinomycetota bacterium]
MRKNQRPPTVLLTVGVLAAGALAACSSGASSSSSDSASASATASQPSSVGTSGSASATPAPSNTGKPVTGADLTALLAGRTFSGSYQGAPYSEYYDGDGTLRGKDGAGATTGTWKVEGDTVCFTFTSDANPETGCYTANVDGNTVYWFKDGKYNDTATFVVGNPNNY